jgi:large subunit ribosomal protein L25
MERVELRSQARTIHGKQVKQLRREDWIPAVVYGPDMDALSIQVQERSLAKALHSAGSTMLIDLFVDEKKKPRTVLAREIQRDPLTGRVEHVDFFLVRLTQKVKTTPRLEFVGEPPVLKSGIAVVIHNMTEIEVECLPTDLINSIPVDMSRLETLDDSIFVSDLPVPPGVTLLADPTDVVVSAVPTRLAMRAEEGEEVEEMEAAAAEAAAEAEADEEA